VWRTPRRKISPRHLPIHSGGLPYCMDRGNQRPIRERSGRPFGAGRMSASKGGTCGRRGNSPTARSTMGLAQANNVRKGLSGGPCYEGRLSGAGRDALVLAVLHPGPAAASGKGKGHARRCQCFPTFRWHRGTPKHAGSRGHLVSALMRALAFMAADEADDGRTDEVRPISKFVLNIGCKGSSSSNPAISARTL
jgi:hypothetical protein